MLSLPVDRVLVFGSNLSGFHGGGAARDAAEKFGAVHGQGFGRAGQSFAIPTKDEHIVTLGLDEIELYVRAFVEHSRRFPGEFFQVTQLGCGLAGLDPWDMAHMFGRRTPVNCHFDEAWRPFLATYNHRFWGTYSG